MAAHFVLSHARKLVSQGLYNAAATMLHEQGAPPDASQLALYCQVALGALALPAAKRDVAAEACLKEVLFDLHNKLQVRAMVSDHSGGEDEGY